MQLPMLEIIKIVMGSGGLFGLIVIVFRTGQLAEQLKQIYGNHLPHIYQELQAIRERLNEIQAQR